MDKINNLSRVYFAKNAVENNLVKNVSVRENISEFFKKPNTPIKDINESIEKYHSELEKEIINLKLSGYERVAFLATEAIGHLMSQTLNYVAGDLSIDKKNPLVGIGNKGRSYSNLTQQSFKKRISQAIKDADLSDRLLKKEEFENNIEKIVSKRLNYEGPFFLFDHIYVEKKSDGDIFVQQL